MKFQNKETNPLHRDTVAVAARGRAGEQPESTCRGRSGTVAMVYTLLGFESLVYEFAKI